MHTDRDGEVRIMTGTYADGQTIIMQHDGDGKKRIATGTTQAGGHSWKGYLCKVRDIPDCKAGKKRVYPRAERYPDKDTCYQEFENIWLTDPEMIRRYPQTSDPDVSYIFGCVPAE